MDPYELETTPEGQIALLPRVYTVRLSCGKPLVNKPAKLVIIGWPDSLCRTAPLHSCQKSD